MLKVGTFFDRVSNMSYVIFEQDTKGFYRLDITDNEDTDIFSIRNTLHFSLVRRKKEFILGDSTIYSRFELCKNKARNLNSPLESFTRFDDGKFVSGQLKRLNDLNLYEIQLLNGRIDQELYYYDGSQIILRVLQVESSAIEPFNLNKYVSRDVVKSVTSDMIKTSDYIPYETLKVMYPLEHIESRDYAVISSYDELDLLKALLLEKRRVIGFDTETDTLDWFINSQSNLVGFVISGDKAHSRYVPLKHISSDICNLSQSDFIDFVIWCNDNDIPLVAHNKKFEVKIWIHLQYNHYLQTGILLPDIRINDDSLIASVLNNPVVIKRDHGLKVLRERLEGLPYLELHNIFPSEIYFPVLDKETTRVYACPDADGTVDVLEDQLNFMQRNHPSMFNLYHLEVELAYLKAEQEFYGLRIDEDATLHSSLIAENNRELLLNLIHKMLGETIEINKPYVVSNLIYNILKCPVLVRTDTGRPSTGAAALDKLCKEKRSVPSTAIKHDIVNRYGDLLLPAKQLNNAKYPVLHLLRAWRDYNKQITGFYNKIKREKYNSRFFFKVNQNGTETGRQSSSIHQMSKDVRHVILPDSDVHDLIVADYSQMELRLFFSAAGETSLVELCKDPDIDIHRAIAAVIQNKEVWDISSEERSKDKTRNFGVIYQISGRGLAIQRHGVGATKEQIEESQQAIDLFFKKFKRCARYVKHVAMNAQTDLFVETLFGRKRYLRELADPNINRALRATLLRRAINLPIQGTGADCMKIAEVAVNKEFKRRGWNKLVDTPQGKLPFARVMISVHDELSVSKHKSIPLEEILDILTSCMEMQLSKDGVDWSPLFIGIKVCNHWGEGKEDFLDLPRQLRFQLIDTYKNTGVSSFSSSFSTRDELAQLINKYRDSRLKDYMEDLIRMHGTDSQVLWEKLRHPSLTHELIARFPQDEEDIRVHGKLSHRERMLYSINQYLVRRVTSVDVKPSSPSPSSDISDDIIIKYFEEITGLQNEVVYEDEEYVNEVGDDTLLDIDSIVEIDKRVSTDFDSRSHIIEFFDTIYFVTDGLYDSDVDELIKLVWVNKVADGFYSTHLFRHGQIIDMKFKVEELTNRDEIEKYIRDKIDLHELETSTFRK